MPTLQTPSGSMYYEVSGQGRPVVYIHCPALSHDYWNPVVDQMAATHQCISYDLRGHGQSSDTAADWGLDDLAADLHALVSGLGLQRPLVVGYSSGSLVALTYVLRYPGSAAGAVLSGGFASCKGFRLQGKVLAGIWTSRPGLARFQALAIASTNHADEQHHRQLKVCAQQVRPHALACLHRAAWRVDLRGDLRAVREPVMLMVGQRDQMSWPNQRPLQEGLRHATLRVFSAADHHLPTMRIGLFADQVADFALHSRAGQPLNDFARVPPAFMVAPQPVARLPGVYH